MKTQAEVENELEMVTKDADITKDPDWLITSRLVIRSTLRWVLEPNIATQRKKRKTPVECIPFDFLKNVANEYRWGWSCGWMGWRRMLRLAVAIDLRFHVVRLVVFGLSISWGRQIRKWDEGITTALPVTNVAGKNGVG